MDKRPSYIMKYAVVRSRLAKCAVLSAGIVFGFSAFSADDTSLTDLVNFKVSEETLDASKLSAIRENGLAAGVQGGMIERSKQIVAEVNKQSASLDRAFDFNPLVSGDGYLPPVIDKVTDKTDLLHSAQRIEYAGVIYKIVSPAHFIRIAPTWRDYLFAGIGDKRLHIDSPPETLLPKTDAEKAAWKTAVEEGWAQGEKQANQIFEENTQCWRRSKTDPFIGVVPTQN
ncbi:type IV secretory system conjugative DNA transfer family protein [Ferrovum myxofaciens]|uniref:type IV secretory system conjugative DNA transfer family protein n=1 Tax=Ferrovum myxofaciens TaxID=416213 RepID=UPI003EBDC127